MVIKLLQQSTFRRYVAIVLSPFFYFCCFRCVTVPLTGVINYVFLHLLSLVVWFGNGVGSGRGRAWGVVGLAPPQNKVTK